MTGEIACDCLEHANKSWCCAINTGIIPPQYQGWFLLAVLAVLCIGTVWFILTKFTGER